MTGLLVSVRNAVEAAQAVAGGADVIDVKEPNRGALGAADPVVWRDVRRAIPVDVPLSVALGELSDEDIAARAAQVPKTQYAKPQYAKTQYAKPQYAKTQYAKVGLAGCLKVPDWRSRWENVLDELPHDTERVAVAYADHLTAFAPPPSVVLQAASTVNCRLLLLDTFTKERGDLFSHLDDEQLHKLSRDCQAAGIDLVLAGSLQFASVGRALALAPTLIAVRGAACQGDRKGSVCSTLVKRLKGRITTNLEGNLISR